MVWLVSEKCWGRVVRMTTHYSLVKYYHEGLDVEEWMENDEIIDVKDMGIDYELEEDI
jgi:hypothetical protein